MAQSSSTEEQGKRTRCATCNPQTKRAARLVMYPGEQKIGSVTYGTIYVLDDGGAVLAKYRIAAGPPIAYGDRGHTATPTPAGNYKLGSQHHHTTLNWPNSAIPWGAEIRNATDPNNVCEYRAPGSTKWTPVGGPNGAYHAAQMRGGMLDPAFRSMAPATRDSSLLKGDKEFCSSNVGKTYKDNDFGKWAWNLVSDGKATPYYLHTTPDDETDAAAVRWADLTPQERDSHRSNLVNSHGCIHVYPSDRDEMMERGYLQGGLPFEVKPYGSKGPP